MDIEENITSVECVKMNMAGKKLMQGWNKYFKFAAEDDHVGG